MQVTTVHRKQVFLAPGQHGYDPGLVGNQGALPGEHCKGHSCIIMYMLHIIMYKLLEGAVLLHAGFLNCSSRHHDQQQLCALLHMCMFLLYDAVVLLKQTGWGLCRSGSRGLGMGKHGVGAVSPRHNARHFSDTQRPLRQLLSGNSGQARGGGFPKPYGLGGGAHMKACTTVLC